MRRFETGREEQPMATSREGQAHDERVWISPVELVKLLAKVAHQPFAVRAGAELGNARLKAGLPWRSEIQAA